MTVTAAQVKDLRERTGAGMLDCQKALKENGGDIDKSIVWLREKGLSSAAKKSGRVAAEGIVVTRMNPEKTSGVILEFNCETDFTGKNPEFVGFAEEMAGLVLQTKAKTDTELLSQKASTGKTVETTITDMVARIGENMKLRRFQSLCVSKGVVAGYSHMGGKIAALVAIEGANGAEIETLAQDIAIHIVASSPRYLGQADVNPAELEQEKEITRNKMKNEGKPDAIIEKIVMGNINKFFKEVCLLEQEFVKDPTLTIKKLVEKVNPNCKVAGFIRYGLGEGIEKKTEDFAAEVAAAMK